MPATNGPAGLERGGAHVLGQIGRKRHGRAPDCGSQNPVLIRRYMTTYYDLGHARHARPETHGPHDPERARSTDRARSRSTASSRSISRARSARAAQAGRPAGVRGAAVRRFAVSRITVRQAIEELVRKQLLVRKQGKGTFVTHAGGEARSAAGCTGCSPRCSRRPTPRARSCCATSSPRRRADIAEALNLDTRRRPRSRSTGSI